MSGYRILPVLLAFLSIFCFCVRSNAAKSFGTSENLTGAFRGQSLVAPETKDAQQLAVKKHAEAPEPVLEMVERSINSSGRDLRHQSCKTGNPIDDCWRCDPDWKKNRKSLADCGAGFGKNAIGGKYGKFYMVTDDNDYDVVSPRPGTLRHAIIQTEPLWIIFQRDMKIHLKEQLDMTSYTTIDGRGANVHISKCACITIQNASNIIIHGIHIRQCRPARNLTVDDYLGNYESKTESDGDGISIIASTNIWVDHCSLSRCTDGLIDVTRGSTAVTISNNHMTHHDKVMLLGHNDRYTQDVKMKVTVAYNHFGTGLSQRMPRCRHGNFEVVNNDYSHWKIYAVGGSANPTINSLGNRYRAPGNGFSKQVTKRENSPKSVWKHWNWRSKGDLMLNGAFFIQSGSHASSTYSNASGIVAMPSSLVGSITANAGALACKKGSPCSAISSFV